MTTNTFQATVLLTATFGLISSACVVGADNDAVLTLAIDDQTVVELFPECRDRVDECLMDEEILDALEEFASEDGLEDLGEFAAAGLSQVRVVISGPCWGSHTFTNQLYLRCKRAGARGNTPYSQSRSCGNKKFKRHSGVCFF